MTYFTQLAQAIRTGSKPPVSLDETVRVIAYLEEVRDQMI